jgi:hypothetical protein
LSTRGRTRRFVFPRTLLLVEIERRCADERCNAKNRVALTKEEARAYRGFTCARCERRHEDALTERDVPDWWEELTLTDLHALRPRRPDAAPPTPLADTSEVVARLSAAWRDSGAEAETETTGGGDAEARAE